MLSRVRLFVTPRTIQFIECPRPRDLPNLEIEPRSPTLQTDSLPPEPQGKPKNTRVGSLPLLQQILPTQESNQGLLHCRQILYQLSYQNALQVNSLKYLEKINVYLGLPGGASGKESTCQREVRDVCSMPWLGRSLMEEMATHSIILACRIPWIE